ncbi:hypothetical protein L249_5501 [Ophiocordyceps polyrhachis-furcata BCC 54312]|uniref:Uncharacterized protein n=1 Tax=Ophiocordyceps polyrhachis-furcata BCC 54312 TaxID=1330021 RepID=A0A367LGE2_9HYPO|nr:hypothetical protein L249_5501 [Ophiocordyceps polyrhachis-furcata BCC 54312]
MGIVIAARELGKSDFLSVRHDFSMRKNVGKKWVCLLKSVGKVESNEVFCGAVEEEEGGEKLVESLSNKVEADNKLEVVLYYSTITWLYVTPFRSASIAYSAPIDVQRADRCNDRCNESIGRYDRYSPTVTQGVVAGLRPNWYNLF